MILTPPYTPTGRFATELMPLKYGVTTVGVVS
jgi:hypothetical protein